MRDASELSLHAREIAGGIQRLPVSQIAGEWNRETAADLRRFLQQQIESHIERRLITAPVLEAA
jgi:DNA repair protein RecO (recombination protein O)